MSVVIDTPAWSKHFSKQLIVAQSTRLGGVSQVPFQSLNLGLHTADSQDYIQENRLLFCQALGCTLDQLAHAHQVHGSSVLQVPAPGYWEGYDALMTNVSGVVLAVSIADCTPLLIYDPVQGAIGAVHAGWKGTIAEIAAKTILEMVAVYGTRPQDCWAYVGTCIGAEDFAVDADVANYFAEKYKRWDRKKGKFFVDLKKANTDQLLAHQLPAAQLDVSPYSTVAANDRYFSHRAERGQTGRMLAAIGLR